MRTAGKLSPWAFAAASQLGQKQPPRQVCSSRSIGLPTPTPRPPRPPARYARPPAAEKRIRPAAKGMRQVCR